MKQGRVVVITGAAGGIGSKLVARFLSNQDQVFAIDNRADALAVLRDCFPAEDRLEAIEGDVSNEADTQRLAQVVRERAGRVDVLVNCAGYYPVVPFEEMSYANWQEVLSINLSSAFLMVRALLPLMKGRGWGKIINIGSGSVFEGVPGQTHYVAAKAGIVGFSRSLAMEVGGYGINVNVIEPGLTMTDPVRREMPASILEDQVKARALKRDEQPFDLAGPVFFLASPDADFVTGQSLIVDGGKLKH